ncbi:MAG: sterol desaturase/sphingolipid hydroxylase (fatty acid hydroxylase superfamily) [Saprospiraceae bacterium]|jgi:sterol desaturase/sphingolipid hydroxylase (fatty acid hydroxylase superfamily)
MKSGRAPHSRNQEVSARIIFPIVMGLGLWLGLWISMSSDGGNVVAKGSPIVLGAILLIALIERMLPYKKEWNRSQNDVGNDTIHLFVTQILIGRIMEPFWAFIIAGVTGYLAVEYGGNLWPHEWHLFLQLGLALLIAEFGRYWIHRWAHEVPWLWRFHAIHHSPKRLYFLNAARFHPLEKVLFLIPETVPFIILGANPECLLLYAIFNSIHGLFQHSNIYIKMGWLNYIFSMTELHRWHHSKKVSESNSNYGNNLIIWDLVFGTFFLPNKREVTEIGLLNPLYPEGYIGQLKAPFSGDIDKPEDYYTNPEKYSNFQ